MDSKPAPEGGNLSQKFLELVQTIARLRDPQNGCPWDLKQTHESLKPYLIEESYETLEAIDHHPDHLAEELGDVLLQILLHSQIAKDNGTFDIGTVIQNLNKKMIHRHPHVFSDVKVTSADEVTRNWEEIKKSEKSGRESILDGIPTSLPALLRAEKISQKAVKVGFDWETTQDVIAKMKEELAELEEALQKKDPKHSSEEAGDFLFSTVNLLRKLKIHPEESLQTANQKFVRRFQKMEQILAQAGKKPESLSLQEWDELWRTIKK